MIDAINQILATFGQKISNFLPDLFGGLLILIVGIIIAGILKRVVLTLFLFFKFERVLQRAKVMSKNEVRLWEEVVAEILRWSLIILFLIPTLEVWGLSRATTVLNQLLFYLPNVIIAVIIAFVGIVSANIASDLVKQSVKAVRATSANALSIFTKGVIVFFTFLVVLNQLGVAEELIVVLFGGIIGMLALAGGLAFGLGGRETAREILENLKKKLQ